MTDGSHIVVYPLGPSIRDADPIQTATERGAFAGEFSSLIVASGHATIPPLETVTGRLVSQPARGE